MPCHERPRSCLDSPPAHERPQVVTARVRGEGPWPGTAAQGLGPPPAQGLDPPPAQWLGQQPDPWLEPLPGPVARAGSGRKSGISPWPGTLRL